MPEFILQPMRRATDKPLAPHPHDASEPCPGGCEDILVVEDAINNAKKDIASLDARIKEAHEETIILKTLVGEASAQMIRVMAAVASTNTTLEKNTSETSEILEILRMGKSFFKFAGLFGRFIKWALAIGASVAGILAAMHFGDKQ